MGGGWMGTRAGAPPSGSKPVLVRTTADLSVQRHSRLLDEGMRRVLLATQGWLRRATSGKVGEGGDRKRRRRAWAAERMMHDETRRQQGRE